MSFRNDASEFVYMRTYSRWRDDLGRRETWPETVERLITFIVAERGDKIPPKVIRKLRERMLEFSVMPSMRALWAAGDAAKTDNTTMYNCAFHRTDSIESFSEALYILMCGTGDGFRVSKADWMALPVVPKLIPASRTPHVIEDSKAGWADSLKTLIVNLYNGHDVTMDYSKIRPQGSRLKTMGGRASGPGPLMVLHKFVREVFAGAQGRKLLSIEIHDILNQVAEIVEVGGVRRSSEISLSDLDDIEMRNAKVGEFPLRRHMANNSAVYETKPTAVDFLKEWAALAASGTGERGIFNLEAARRTSPKRRLVDLIAGCNPCAEILLRSKQFCNLSEVVARADDDLDELLDKVETAVWIGVIQSTFTHFPYLSPEWKKNCEEERLLGVSITGQMDAPHLFTPEAFKILKNRAIKVAKKASQIMGINMPAAVTCVKPSGTVSQLVDSSSGVHPRYARYYIRRYRISANDPLFRMMRDQKVPMSPENGQRKKDWNEAKRLESQGQNPFSKCPIYVVGQEYDENLVNTWIVSFPVKAPEKCLVKSDTTAIQQLEWYKKVQTNWCEHNASTTIYVRDEEWFEVGNWVYQNWDIINGVSFLPADGGKYEQAPYEEITKEEYTEMSKKMPKIDYSKLTEYEKEDYTQGARTLACSGGVCELN